MFQFSQINRIEKIENFQVNKNGSHSLSDLIGKPDNKFCSLFKFTIAFNNPIH